MFIINHSHLLNDKTLQNISIKHGLFLTKIQSPKISHSYNACIKTSFNSSQLKLFL